MNMSDFDPFFPILSLILVGSIIVIIKLVEYTKFQTLKGSHKATSVVFIILGVSESLYLSRSMGLLIPAIEIVTSLSAILLFFTFVYLNKLQNAVSGMSIALSPRMNVGDEIECKGKRGIITQIGLSKTIVKLEDSDRLMFIPNKKLDEEISIIKKIKTTHNNIETR